MPETAVFEDVPLTERFARSAARTAAGAADLLGWLALRARANSFRVERIAFDQLDGWQFDARTGNLGHRSGRFFTVVGMHATVDGDPRRSWSQPIINQPEAGILGIVAKEFDGVLHFLMQAKMEPGNCNLVQLSPTVQATPSNYRQVHRGSSVKYLDYFVQPGAARVLVDVLQSEHGAWFYRKSNRNMIVEVDGDVPLHDDFRWLTLGQIGELLPYDDVVSMDSRTVLSCAPAPASVGGRPSLHSDFELLSWFTEIRSRQTLNAERAPLAGLPDWVRGETSIDRADGRFFSIVAVAVEAASREVTSWSQPILEPHGLGVNAFLSTEIAGVLHVLAHARVEGGLVDEVELGPTVQTSPDNWPAEEQQPRFLDQVRSADPARIRFEAVLSEEGGRLMNARSRYLVVDTDPFEAPPGYHWVTARQLSTLVKHSHYVNVQARTLLTCLNAMACR